MVNFIEKVSIDGRFALLRHAYKERDSDEKDKDVPLSEEGIRGIEALGSFMFSGRDIVKAVGIHSGYKRTENTISHAFRGGGIDDSVDDLVVYQEREMIGLQAITRRNGRFEKVDKKIAKSNFNRPGLSKFEDVKRLETNLHTLLEGNGDDPGYYFNSDDDERPCMATFTRSMYLAFNTGLDVLINDIKRNPSKKGERVLVQASHTYITDVTIATLFGNLEIDENNLTVRIKDDWRGPFLEGEGIVGELVNLASDEPTLRVFYEGKEHRFTRRQMQYDMVKLKKHSRTYHPELQEKVISVS